MKITAICRNFALYLLIFLSENSYSQEAYSDIPENRKKIVFNDNFKDNSNGWPNLISKNGVMIVSGPFTIISTETITSKIQIKIDLSLDFEIETEMAFKSLVSPNFFFEKLNWNIHNQWNYIELGKKSLAKFKADPPEKNEIHKYTIRKINNLLLFFIDEKFYTKIESPIAKDAGLIKIGYKEFTQLKRLTLSYILKPGENLTEELPNRTADKPNGVKIEAATKSSRYFALIMGVSDYESERLNLARPVKDAENLRNILVRYYIFQDSNVNLITNPTRQKIISELYRLRKIIGPNDNLLIFYAGHGYWDEDARQGYWWAKDAAPDDPSTWLSNSDLREQIRSIKSAHTLLISDACFSGGIFKTRSGNDIQNASKDIQLLYSMPSRRAITSGTMTTVPDNSVFLEYLAKRLTENKNKFLSSQQLFDSFRAAVINNSNVVPQDGVIAETGDEGGDFIFILKEN